MVAPGAWFDVVDSDFFPGSSGTAYTAAPSETVTLAEALAAGFAAAAGLAESVAAAEALGTVRAAVAGLAEGADLAEGIGTVRAAVAGLAESSALTEGIGAARGTAAAPAETVALAEALAGGTGYTATPAETVTLAELLAAGTLYTASPAETVTLGGTLAAGRAAVASLLESVALAEAFAIVVPAPITTVVAAVCAVVSRAEHSQAVTIEVQTVSIPHLRTTVILRGTFTDAAGNPYDPTNVRLTWRRPVNGRLSDTVIATSNPSPGVYQASVYIAELGQYRYRFDCLDAGYESASSGSFFVRAL